MPIASIPPVSSTVETAPAPLVLPETGFVRQKLLLHFIPLSRSTLWRWVNAGAFPNPVRLSDGITAWRAEDVRRWITERR
jgi:prophage regulatory protein